MQNIVFTLNDIEIMRVPDLHLCDIMKYNCDKIKCDVCDRFYTKKYYHKHLNTKRHINNIWRKRKNKKNITTIEENG